jgi:hypothetical protein
VAKSSIPQALHAIKSIRFFDQGDCRGAAARASCNTSSAPRGNATSGVSFSTGWVHIKFIIMHRARRVIYLESRVHLQASAPSFFRREKRRIPPQQTHAHRALDAAFLGDLNMAIFLRPDVSGSFCARKKGSLSAAYTQIVELSGPTLLCVYPLTHSFAEKAQPLGWFIYSLWRCARVVVCSALLRRIAPDQPHALFIDSYLKHTKQTIH